MRSMVGLVAATMMMSGMLARVDEGDELELERYTKQKPKPVADTREWPETRQQRRARERADAKTPVARALSALGEK